MWGVFVCLSLCVCVCVSVLFHIELLINTAAGERIVIQDLLENRFPTNEFFNNIHVVMKYYILDLVFMHIQQKFNKLLKA